MEERTRAGAPAAAVDEPDQTAGAWERPVSEQRLAAEFPPQVLREYALLADGERGALIGPRGDVAWMCAPRWHSDAVFSPLIGGGGCYAITPADPRFVWGAGLAQPLDHQ